MVSIQLVAYCAMQCYYRRGVERQVGAAIKASRVIEGIVHEAIACGVSGVASELHAMGRCRQVIAGVVDQHQSIGELAVVPGAVGGRKALLNGDDVLATSPGNTSTFWKRNV